MKAEIRLPDLTPLQRQITESKARFRVLCCGRRFGKTTVALDLIADHLIAGHLVAYFAPAYRMTDEVWTKAEKMFAPLIKRTRKDEYRLDLLNGAVFECWTAGRETVRGRAYHFVVIDEAALVASSSLWYEAIRPLLADYQGSALFASTPRGRNWFHSLFSLGLDPSQDDWQSWQFQTAHNPYIKAEEVEDAREHMPERAFKQEYLAEFLEDGGSVFRGIDAVCISEYEPIAEDGKQYVFGVDWGKSEDFTAISVMDITGRQVVLDRFNQISYNVQRDRLKALYERFKPILILAEANSIGAVNIDALQAEGLPVRPFYTSGASKPALIEAFNLAIEREQIQLLNDAILKSELQAYEMSRTASGHWQYNAPVGAHDDTIIATALSLYAVQRYRSISVGFA